MEVVENLIPDTKGNHLVVALYFYDSDYKEMTLHIPTDFFDIEIADINIAKLNDEMDLHYSALYTMCRWLLSQFMMYPNSVFTFICSTDELKTNHKSLDASEYRWALFKRLCNRYSDKILSNDIQIKDIIVGPERFQSYSRIFYRKKHESIIQYVSEYIEGKYH